ncbi:DUF6191 domain-containing protein [Actinokineospora sp. NBRC 105648]|uniref:DUF6191 domain-containing protein n=1 Tax=Actinokineospora sp. NBRC 105648 TaxID=3032206 RepID=UPI0024A0E16E|nr:DUF6191 domain-containing protein [Actinokineospora sp. NBRC 105648]GLZ41815.1 hypothetical protein Acsp05_54390 [Actinokineospora sp. NBRC 105648]
MDSVEAVLTWSIPGGVLAMVAVGTVELARSKRRGRAGAAPLTSTYVNEFTALFYGTKRTELDHRDSTSMMREEDAQGERPWLGEDLERGIVLPRRRTED